MTKKQMLREKYEKALMAIGFDDDAMNSNEFTEEQKNFFREDKNDNVVKLNTIVEIARELFGFNVINNR